MTNKRRPITWGPNPAGNLAPFEVDAFGRIFNAQTNKIAKPMSRIDAAKTWNEDAGGSRWRQLDPARPNHIGQRIRGPKAEDLIRGYSDDLLLDPLTGKVFREAQIVTRWLFDDRAPTAVWSDASNPPPKCDVAFEPDEWIRASGELEEGWVVLRMDKEFNSLFHGPSMAARQFDTPST